MKCSTLVIFTKCLIFNATNFVKTYKIVWLL